MCRNEYGDIQLLKKEPKKRNRTRHEAKHGGRACAARARKDKFSPSTRAMQYRCPAWPRAGLSLFRNPC